MLRLASATDPAWARQAVCHPGELLLDHAHCEKKAAGAALNLIFRYPEHAALMEPLSALAREELAHFEEVLRQLRRLGVPFRRQRPSPYAGRLHRAVRREEPERLLDTLLCCALIEARSCERLRLLAEAWSDPELARLYRGLLAAEARHHGLYVELAGKLFPAARVAARLSELSSHEAAAVGEPADAPRLHADPPSEGWR